MGFAGISIPQLTIILLIAVVIFGTKRLKTIGADLGGALRSFRSEMNAPDKPDERLPAPPTGSHDPASNGRDFN